MIYTVTDLNLNTLCRRLVMRQNSGSHSLYGHALPILFRISFTSFKYFIIQTVLVSYSRPPNPNVTLTHECTSVNRDLG